MIFSNPRVISMRRASVSELRLSEALTWASLCWLTASRPAVTEEVVCREEVFWTSPENRRELDWDSVVVVVLPGWAVGLTWGGTAGRSKEGEGFVTWGGDVDRFRA